MKNKSKYRIVKIHDSESINKVDYYYIIEKRIKFLFIFHWWWSVTIKNTHVDRKFSYESEARSYVDKLLNPRKREIIEL